MGAEAVHIKDRAAGVDKVLTAGSVAGGGMGGGVRIGVRG